MSEAEQQGKLSPAQTYMGCGIPEQVLSWCATLRCLSFPHCLLKSQSFAVSPSAKALGVFTGFFIPQASCGGSRLCRTLPHDGGAAPVQEQQPSTSSPGLYGLAAVCLCPTPGLIPENIAGGSKQSRAWLPDKNTSRQQDEICSNFSLKEKIQRQK